MGERKGRTGHFCLPDISIVWREKCRKGRTGHFCLSDINIVWREKCRNIPQF